MPGSVKTRYEFGCLQKDSLPYSKMKLALVFLLALLSLAVADNSEQDFLSSLAQFTKDRQEAVDQGVGRLSDGRSKREVSPSNNNWLSKRAIGPIKANAVRLNLPDVLKEGNGTGRVEVYNNGRWGTVCDKDWDLQDAQVVCSELGMVKAIHESRKAKYGQGVGNIWMGGLQCTGKELSIWNCKRDHEKGTEGCTHADDAGVKCLHTGIPAIIEVGCYKDQDKPNRALRHMIANLRDEIDWYNVRSMVTKCAERAHEGEYQYFGIQFYGECWVDKEGAARYHMHGKAESKKCYEGTGMHFTNFVYRFAPWKDLGCWTDVEADRTMNKVIVSLRYKIDWFNIDKTVYDCYEAAKQGGFKYFSVQFYGECWASNEGRLYRKHGHSVNCWSGVGGKLANYVYQVLE